MNLGRLGGLEGGRARAVMLSSERRIEIARKAAQASEGSNYGCGVIANIVMIGMRLLYLSILSGP